MLHVAIPERQFVEWARQLPPEDKRDLLRALIPEMDRFEAIVDYGQERVRSLCKERGIDWDALSPEQREQLVDDLVHEP